MYYLCPIIYTLHTIFTIDIVRGGLRVFDPLFKGLIGLKNWDAVVQTVRILGY